MPPTTPTTLRVAAVVAALVACVQAGVARAGCDPSTDPDRTDVANARAAVAASCDCSDATAHDEYVDCARTTAVATLVNPECAPFVRKCAARSTCGHPGYVTCCRTTSRGSTRCSIKNGGTRCRAANGGSVCVGQVASCCDACDGTTCATSTTTTTASTSLPPTCLSTTTTTTLPMCTADLMFCALGVCFNGQTCEFDAGTGQCGCTGPPPTCGQWGIEACGGTCPEGSTCRLENVAVFPPGCAAVRVCHCVAGP